MEALDFQLLGQLGLAIVLGGLVGLERELLEKPAGLRTNILICLGATLFTHLSVELAAASGPPADPARIAAQVVSGIGFLGAGAIIQSRGNVTGLTTAATIWVVAAIGTALGLGATFAAVLGTASVIVVLVGLGVIERYVVTGWTGLEMRLRMADDADALAGAMRALAELGLEPTLREVGRDPRDGVRTARVHARIQRLRLPGLAERLLDVPEIVAVTED